MSKELKNGRHEDEAGTIRWYQCDILHREDGPAIVYSNNEKEWYLNDVKLTEAEFNERTAILIEVTPTGKRVKI